MSKVVDLAQARDDRKPHVSGECFCLSCGHKWVQVEPTPAEGITWIDCPACMRKMGRYKFRFVKADAFYWECSCGCDIFKLYRDAKVAMCPNCGKEKPLIEIFDGQ